MNCNAERSLVNNILFIRLQQLTKRFNSHSDKYDSIGFSGLPTCKVHLERCRLLLSHSSAMLLGDNNHWFVVLGHVGAQKEAFHELLADGTAGDFTIGHKQDQ